MISFDLLDDLNNQICQILKENNLNSIIKNVNKLFEQTREKQKISNQFKSTNKSFFLSGESIDSSESCLNVVKKIIIEGHLSKTLNSNTELDNKKDAKAESSKKV